MYDSYIQEKYIAVNRVTKGKHSINSDKPLILALVEALNWVEDHLKHELAEAGYRPFKLNQSLLICNILLGINRPSALAQQLGISRQAVSVMINELESEGIVETMDDPNHKLAKIVQIKVSVKNKKLNAAVHNAFEKTERLLEERIGKTKLKHFKAALKADWGPTIEDLN